MKDILLNVGTKEKRVAILKCGQVQDLIIERKKDLPLSGNIYRGHVTNILENIQSAFVSINEEENGFIHISDLVENTQKFKEMFDMEFEWNAKPSEKQTNPQDISKLLKLKDSVLVQVIKEPIGSKGARLTSSITIPGRYLVLLPNMPHRGVSRKIQNRAEREHLKKIIRSFEMPSNMGLICRTASASVPLECLVDEANELLETWNRVITSFEQYKRPACLHRESDLVKKALFIAVDKKFDRLLIDDHKTYRRCCQDYKKFSLEHPLQIELYRDKAPLFDRFKVEIEINKALKREVRLNSGGCIVIEKTEAMTTIDVNSGRSLTTSVKRNLEESLVKINMEAAIEIARQLRLRNMGGLIICDFIDMRFRKNQRRVLDCLKEAMKEDSAKCTILGMSEFGLVEMTRQRSRKSLQQIMLTTCPYCQGLGSIKNLENTLIAIEYHLLRLLRRKASNSIEIVYHPDVEDYMNKQEHQQLEKLAKKFHTSLQFRSDDTLHLNDFVFYSTTTKKKLEF